MNVFQAVRSQEAVVLVEPGFHERNLNWFSQKIEMS
jgi:hypothetical protein